MGLAEFPFVVSLPEELLVSSGQYSYRFDGLKALLLRRTELELDPAIFPSARTLTEVRIRAGLRPLVLENEASEAARSHLSLIHI